MLSESFIDRVIRERVVDTKRYRYISVIRDGAVVVLRSNPQSTPGKFWVEIARREK